MEQQDSSGPEEKSDPSVEAGVTDHGDTSGIPSESEKVESTEVTAGEGSKAGGEPEGVVSTADTVESTPTHTVESTSADKVESTPTDKVESTPTVTVESTPTVTVESTPAVTVESTPAVTVESTPAVTVDSTPAVTVESTPAVTVESTPAIKVESTPTVTVKSTVTVDLTPTVTVESKPPVTVESAVTVQTTGPTADDKVEKSPEVPTSTKAEPLSTIARSAEEGVVSLEGQDANTIAELKDHPDTTVLAEEDAPSQSHTGAEAGTTSVTSLKEDSEEPVTELTEKCVLTDTVTVIPDSVKMEAVIAKTEVQESNADKSNKSEVCSPCETGLSATKAEEVKAVGSPSPETAPADTVPTESAKTNSKTTSSPCNDNHDILKTSSEQLTTDSQKEQTSDIPMEHNTTAAVEAQQMEVDYVVSESGTVQEEPMETEVVDALVEGTDEEVSGAVSDGHAISVKPEVAVPGQCSGTGNPPTEVSGISDQVDDSVTPSEAVEGVTTDCKMEADDVALLENGAMPTAMETCEPRPEVDMETKPSEAVSQPDPTTDTHSGPVSPAQIVPDVDTTTPPAEPKEVKQEPADKSLPPVDKDDTTSTAEPTAPRTTYECVSEPSQQLLNVDSVATVAKNAEAVGGGIDSMKQAVVSTVDATVRFVNFSICVSHIVI